MSCFGISEQEIEDTLSNIKTAYCNSTTVTDNPASPEQCVKALKVAVERITKVKKNGKRTLKKTRNLNLKNEVEDAFKELAQLQDDSGPDKAQKCYELARKWRNGVKDPDSTYPQLLDHEDGRSIYNASISSDGSHSIPDQFYEASMASKSDSHDEGNSGESTPGSSKSALDVSRIEEPDDDLGDESLSHRLIQRGRYEKNTGCFADAAPRTALMTKQTMDEIAELEAYLAEHLAAHTIDVTDDTDNAHLERWSNEDWGNGLTRAKAFRETVPSYLMTRRRDSEDSTRS